jgi:ABC-2 type transport system permease protein
MKITFTRVVYAEWTKLVALRSTWYTLIAVSVLTVGVAGAIGYGIAHSSGAPPSGVADAVAAAFLPVDFMVLVVGVLGVLQMTGEYGSGLVRATLTAVPRRWPVLGAKAVVLGGLVAPWMAATCLAAFLVCQAFLGDHGASLGDPGVVRAILGAAGSLVLTGLVGLGIGAMLRHTAGAITTLVVAIFVAPALLGPAIPGDGEKQVLKFVPTVAGQAMYAIDGSGSPFKAFSPAGSALVLAGWAALLLAGGLAVLWRRDA